MTGSIGVSSCARLAGRMNGTSSPASLPTAAIASESVVRIMRSIAPERRAASAVRSSRVRPASARRFLSGTPFDPPRAGTIARTRPEEVVIARAQLSQRSSSRLGPWALVLGPSSVLRPWSVLWSRVPGPRKDQGRRTRDGLGTKGRTKNQERRTKDYGSVSRPFSVLHESDLAKHLRDRGGLR